ncbi:hypothetical protein [Aliikangiella sp. IMCC44359]|uniref:hypothetical protein n=1 Tax=Aliikangiella sp. IMCC44359 TaxID=3459125 RepID=UPI00403A8EBD
MDLASNLDTLLPLACEWANQISHEIQNEGKPLSVEEIRIAKMVGVNFPEKVRVFEAPSLALPKNVLLKEAALATGLLGDNMAGLTLGHSIYIRQGQMSIRLLSHELRHVYQYEKLGSIENFMVEYLSQIIKYGYYDAPLEVDARTNEITSLLET